MVTRGWLVVALAGCYQPAPEAGAPCADGDRCPSGLVCVGGRCQLPGTLIDGAAGEGAAIDAPITADAELDAALTWSSPQPIPGVNTAAGEDDPSLTADRLTIVFTRASDLFLGTRAAVGDAFTVTELAGLNSPADEASPEISADGTTLYFTSDRLVTGDGDIYVSVRDNGSFTTATRVAELSDTGADDGDLAISPDGLTAIIARNNVMLRATRASTAAAWGAPASLGLNLGTSPAAPSLTMAGDLYFHADAERNLYVARKSGTTFGAPMPISELNTNARDAGPFISANERALWFGRAGDLYESFK